MPTKKLINKPGIQIEYTPTLNESGYSSGQLIRWFAQLPQKLGGWAQLVGVPPFVGTCRGLFGWSDFLSNPYLAVGTEQRLSVLIGNALFDITPLRTTTNPAVAFSTTSGSSIVTIADNTNGLSGGDWINLVTAVSVGGIVMQGYYRCVTVIDGTHYTVDAGETATATVVAGGATSDFAVTNGSATVTVTLANHGLATGEVFTVGVSTTIGGVVISGLYAIASVVDANTFTITASSVASSTTTGFENGGNARIEYLLPSGYAVNTALTGYGIGDYGAGDWGLAGVAQTFVQLRQWALSNFGQDLVASPTNGAIYYWAPPSPTPAVVVDASAPIYNRSMFTMSQVQMIVGIGSETGGNQYPTLVRWCDAGNFADWTASVTNQAGSFQIPTGSQCIAGLAVGLGALIWTDVDLWSMTYQGLPFVFGFNRVGTRCEAISAKAPAVIGNSVLWPSNKQFFRYDGSGVTPLECPVWDFFYTTADFSQSTQIFSATNTLFNEVAWYFPIGVDAPQYGVVAGDIGYVKFNYLESLWDYGVLPRTAWVDNSPVGNPIGADPTGLLQQHETTNDANGAPMISWLRTGYFDIMDGTDYAFVDLLIPDFSSGVGYTVQFTVYATDYPGQTPRQYGPYPATPTTEYINVRVRGRQAAIEIRSEDLGSFWRLGAVRYRFAPDGRR
jgi:hypothetical protein